MRSVAASVKRLGVPSGKITVAMTSGASSFGKNMLGTLPLETSVAVNNRIDPAELSVIAGLRTRHDNRAINPVDKRLKAHSL